MDSSSTLQFPLNAAPFALQASQHSPRFGVAESDTPDMLRGNPEFAGDRGVVHANAMALPHCLLCWAKTGKLQFGPSNPDPLYRHGDIRVKRKIAAAMSLRELPLRIRALRKSLGLKQKDFGARLGVKQVSVSQWENEENPAVPAAKILLKMSEMAPLAEVPWWRDRAAEQVGVDAVISTTSGALAVPELTRKIPLFLNPKMVGTVATPAQADVEQFLQFSPDLFPEGGMMEAVRVMVHASRELVAVVDVSRHDADRLVGNMVAVRTATGIEVRWLEREGGIYLLLPFHPGQQPRALRHSGDGSVVGVIRWIGNSIPRPPAGTAERTRSGRASRR